MALHVYDRVGARDTQVFTIQVDGTNRLPVLALALVGSLEIDHVNPYTALWATPAILLAAMLIVTRYAGTG